MIVVVVVVGVVVVGVVVAVVAVGSHTATAKDYLHRHLS